MPTLTSSPIETYLLAGQAAPLACGVCHYENRISAERCHKCVAPLSIARQASKRKQLPKRIAVIGAAGIGKTTYLGMLLDMLMRRSGSLETTLLGPQSISLQQLTTTALAAGWYPDKTPRDPEQWHWVHCQVSCKRRRKRVDTVFVDFPGEALAASIEHPEDFPSVRAMLTDCAGIMVLADASRLRAGEHDDDYLSLKLLSMACDLRSGSKRWLRRPILPPLALVLTKSDTSPSCMDDPLGFAENHAHALWSDIQRRFPVSEAFAATVVGASGPRIVAGRRCQVPLRVEPRGVVEPFGWLLSHMN